MFSFKQPTAEPHTALVSSGRNRQTSHTEAAWGWGAHSRAVVAALCSLSRFFSVSNLQRTGGSHSLFFGFLTAPALKEVLAKGASESNSSQLSLGCERYLFGSWRQRMSGKSILLRHLILAVFSPLGNGHRGLEVQASVWTRGRRPQSTQWGLLTRPQFVGSGRPC